MRVSHVVLVSLLSLAPAATAFAACESSQCPASEFGSAVEAVRAEIAERCTCDPGDRSTRRPYSLCVGETIREAKKRGDLTKACAKTTRRCALESTCGKPGAVVCCQSERGEVVASVEPENRCERRGGTVCPGVVVAVDACTDEGTCATP